MQANQTRFIHARKLQDFWYAKIQECGGLTVAWKVNEQGNIVVSQPARCLNTDRFERKVGAQIASKNMAEKDPLFVITKEEIIEDCVKVYTNALEQIGDLTPNARLSVVSHYREMINTDFENVITARSIEDITRQKLRETFNSVRMNYAI